MRVKTEADFEAEIAEMRAKLKGAGRQPRSRSLDDQSGIRCDFDLPYSTLPTLDGKRWVVNAPG